jgi:acylphosphatase
VKEAPPTRRARFVVRGLVQGVNFRNAAVREALARRITGRVWNRDDGAVEIVAEGDGSSLEDFARWLQHGPRLAEVESVERVDLEGELRYQEFTITDDPAS